ncbi:hypothetical protein [Streptomyces sp. NPDC051636]|uniref:Rv1733c family protein n=1 Tax=Streptomyces sp. NPDC051636 TaxID=3365663 RepID=UPI003792864E
MPGTTRSMLWRWRGNPLRRRDDVVEAWVLLAVWLIVAVGGAVVGLVTARAAADEFARERAERRPVRAVLLVDVPQTVGQGAGSGDRITGEVRWTAPDGSSHIGRTPVRSGQDAGTRVTVWTDTRGHLRSQPRSGTEATAEASIYGGAAALALAGAAFGLGAAGRHWLDRRRIDAWGREWDRVGPQWGHKTG